MSGLPDAQSLTIDAGGAVRCTLRVPETLPIFSVHFPALPIVPGVELVRWAIVQGRRHFCLPPRVARLEKLRFRRAVRPGAQLELVLSFDATAGSLKYSYECSDPARARVVADGSIFFVNASGA